MPPQSSKSSGLVWYGLVIFVGQYKYVRHQLGLFFHDKSDGEVKLAVQLFKSAVQLYKSADLKAKLLSNEIYTMEFNILKVKLR